MSPVLCRVSDLWARLITSRLRLVLGPCEYVPSVEVDIIDRRRAIPLDENEGIYVRDTRTGKVRSVTGQSYMLGESEELWSKELPASVEALLTSDYDPRADRLCESFVVFCPMGYPRRPPLPPGPVSISWFVCRSRWTSLRKQCP